MLAGCHARASVEDESEAETVQWLMNLQDGTDVKAPERRDLPDAPDTERVRRKAATERPVPISAKPSFPQAVQQREEGEINVIRRPKITSEQVAVVRSKTWRSEGGRKRLVTVASVVRKTHEGRTDAWIKLFSFTESHSGDRPPSPSLAGWRRCRDVLDLRFPPEDAHSLTKHLDKMYDTVLKDDEEATSRWRDLVLVKKGQRVLLRYTYVNDWDGTGRRSYYYFPVDLAGLRMAVQTAAEKLGVTVPDAPIGMEEEFRDLSPYEGTWVGNSKGRISDQLNLTLKVDGNRILGTWWKERDGSWCKTEIIWKPSPDGFSLLASPPHDWTPSFNVSRPDSVVLTLSSGELVMDFRFPKGEIGLLPWRWRLVYRELWEPPKAPGGSLRCTVKSKVGDLYDNTYVSVSADGALLAVGGGLGVEVWDLPSMTMLCTLENGLSNGVKFSPVGNLLATFQSDSPTVRLWDAVAGTSRGELRPDHGNDVEAIAFFPDGKSLAVAYHGFRNDDIIIWDIPSQQERARLQVKGSSPTAVAVSPDGKLLAANVDCSELAVWDIETGQRRYTVQTIEGVRKQWLKSIAFSPDGKTLVTCARKTSIFVWDAATGRKRLTVHAHENGANQVVFSPDGKFFASAGDHDAVRLWDAESGRELMALGEPPVRSPLGIPRMTGVAFLPDGKSVVYADDHGGVYVWDLYKSRPPSDEGSEPPRKSPVADNRPEKPWYAVDTEGCLPWNQ
jgi:WD40 repeat protein